MSAPSHLFATLAGMLQMANERLFALDLPTADDPASSRVWSRQRGGIVQALLVEPPVTVADAIIILATLSEWRDLVEGAGEDMTPRERRDLDEVTSIALTNVNVCFGGSLAQQPDYTADYRETLEWIGNQQKRWLPPVTEAAA